LDQAEPKTVDPKQLGLLIPEHIDLDFLSDLLSEPIRHFTWAHFDFTQGEVASHLQKGKVFQYQGGRFSEEEGQNHVELGILSPNDILEGSSSTLSPTFHEALVRRLYTKLQRGAIDGYYIYHPEDFLPHLGEPLFYETMGRLFESLEKLVREKILRRYGIKTWQGVRTTKQPLSLRQLVKQAELVAGSDHHHFRLIQVPMNLVMLEAFSRTTQEGQTVIEMAKEEQIELVAIDPLMGGMVSKLPSHVFEMMPPAPSKSLQALLFLLSCPDLHRVDITMTIPLEWQTLRLLLGLPLWDSEIWQKVFQNLALLSYHGAP
jgi:hypothetical protein